MTTKMINYVIAACIVLSAVAVHSMPAGSRITLPSGKSIFVSGMNLAWKQFAGDVGDAPLNSDYFIKAFKGIADSGANCMRVWLSTNGTNDPKYDASGLVSGPGSNTIANIQQMLQIAKTNNILLMPVLLTHNFVEKSINSTILANNIKMMTTEEGLQAYIDNYLIPVVSAIGNDPSLICWEVCNEPEGMVQGWSSPANTITKEQVQKFTNWIAAAIHETVPEVLVSNGAVATQYVEWYTDAALAAVGGKTNGTLDFYMAHYYGWNGVSNSPFTKSYAYWNFDKPLVIGEYASTSWSSSTSSSNPMQDAANVDTLLVYLNKAGYAGGLGWQYQQDGGDPWMLGFKSFGHSMAEVFRYDSNSIKLDGTASSTFAIIASAGNGGTLTSSVTGRVEAGASATLTATAAEGYTFSGWTGDTTSADPVLTIENIAKDWVVKANFAPGEGTSLVKEGDFSTSTEWGFYAAEGTDAEVTFTDEQANISISAIDDTTYHIQFTQSAIPIVAGETYVVGFDAWSSGARSMNVDLTTGEWEWQSGGTVELTATKDAFSVELTNEVTTESGVLQFNVGASTLPVYIDNVTFVKKATSDVTVPAFRHAASPVFKHAGDRIYWSALTSEATVSILDLKGRIIQPATKSNPLRLTGIPQGMYLLKIKNGAKTSVHSIVK